MNNVDNQDPKGNRRAMLQHASCGFGWLALQGMLNRSVVAASDPVGASPQPVAGFGRVKRVIFLFMQGGVSQVDSFDYKPTLAQRDGEKMPFDDARVLANTGKRGAAHRLMNSPWKFRPYGESGTWVSDLFPEIGKRSDELCLIRSMSTEGVAHGPSTLFLHCGATVGIRPSMGSWIYYGLGTENENLPGFVTIAPSKGNGGARNFGSAFLPAKFQGTAIERPRPGESNLIRHLQHPTLSLEQQKSQLALLQSINQAQAARTASSDEAAAIIDSYQRAARMQQVAPEIVDIERESASTLAMYGIGEKETDRFGRQCLLARRLCEAGVRYIQVTYGDDSANPAWDQHSNLPEHAKHARATDRPIAALLDDLKQRGLLEETLVWWGGEFGRTPYAQDNGTGRDHNPGGFTVWLAGGGVRQGHSHGSTDEFGHQAIDQRVHMHDLHATILHALGVDHQKLTYRHAGRDFRLTDVHGHIVHELFA